MSLISINITSVIGNNTQLTNLMKSVSSTRKDIQHIERQIDNQIRSHKGIQNRFNSAASELQDLDSNLRELNSFLTNSINMYTSTEKRLVNQSQLYLV